eukprot:8904619-Pyramimonas_sp.AAC.2
MVTCGTPLLSLTPPVRREQRSIASKCPYCRILVPGYSTNEALQQHEVHLSERERFVERLLHGGC